ncbi:MAG: NAD(P)H-dependent oxidoreductase subunit E [Candidatus Omnitrophica bacterium]|nr:NAD(P)H-dependent oxidoreductase subunit E [Candidatus Omnitrophota bacterium]
MITEKSDQDVSVVHEIVGRCRDIEGNLIKILHQVQSHYGYVSEAAIKEVADLLDLPTAKIVEVLTFYNFFKLHPPAKHNVAVCMGTACYLKGGETVRENFNNALNIKDGETTSDGLFQVEAVRCVGCCGLAPTVSVDDKVYGAATKKDVEKIIAKYSNE